MKLDFPNSLVNIESKAFEECSNLQTISLGSSIEKISEKAFAGCSMLSVEFSDVPCNIARNAFEGCKKVKMGDYSIKMLARNIKKYSQIEGFHEGLAKVYRDGAYGFIDKYGNEVIACNYSDCMDFNEGLSRVKKNEKYGYINKTGKVIIPIVYESAGNFHDGLAEIKNSSDKWGYINKSGNVVIPFMYDNTGYFSDGKAKVGRDHQYFLIDKNGNEYHIDNIFLFHFSEGYARAFNRNRVEGYIDTSGRIIIPFEYATCKDFSEGYGCVEKNKYGFVQYPEMRALPALCICKPS